MLSYGVMRSALYPAILLREVEVRSRLEAEPWVGDGTAVAHPLINSASGRPYW